MEHTPWCLAYEGTGVHTEEWLNMFGERVAAEVKAKNKTEGVVLGCAQSIP